MLVVVIVYWKWNKIFEKQKKSKRKETSPLVYRASHWSGFYMIWTYIMKELSASIFQEIEEFKGKNQAEKLQKRYIQSTSWTNYGLCLLILVVFGKTNVKDKSNFIFGIKRNFSKNQQ